MSKKRDKSKQTDQKKKSRNWTGLKKRWTGLHLFAAFLIGAMFGFILGFQPAGENNAETDAYGRSPGDPHYEHQHP